MLTDSAGPRPAFRSRLAGGGLVGSWLTLDLSEVVEIMGLAGFDDAIARVKARGLAAGLSCYDEAEASRRLAAGVDFVTVAGAEKLFLEACRRTVAAVRGGRRAGVRT